MMLAAVGNKLIVLPVIFVACRWRSIACRHTSLNRHSLVGIIRPEDLHRVLDSDMPPQLVNAEDIALATPLSVAPDENLLEALRDFGTRDIETLPVESGQGPSKRLVGLLMRSDVMRRYRQEMLRRP